MLSLSSGSIITLVLIVLLLASGSFNYYQIGKVATLNAKLYELENTVKEVVISKGRLIESCKQDDEAVKTLFEDNRIIDINTKSLQEQLKDLSKEPKPSRVSKTPQLQKIDESINEIPINSKLPTSISRLLDKAYQDNR